MQKSVSMGLLFFVFFILPVKLCQASSEILNFSPDIKYSREKFETYGAFPIELDKILDHRSFDKLIGNNQLRSLNILAQLARIYIPRQLGVIPDNRVVFAIDRLQIKGSIKYGAIYYHPKGHILHFKTKTAGDVALLFTGFKMDRIEEIKTEILKTLGAKSQANIQEPPASNQHSTINFLSSVMLPSSFAADSSSTSPSGLCEGYANTTGTVNNSFELKQFWECTKGGVWNATGEALISIYEFGKLTPVEAFYKINAAFDSFKAMLPNIHGMLGDMKSAFLELPSNLRIKILCEVAWSLTTTGFIVWATFGGGTPLFLRTMAMALKKIAVSLPGNSAIAEKILGIATNLESKAQAAQAALTALETKSAAMKDVSRAEKELDAALKGYKKTSKSKDIIRVAERKITAQMEAEAAGGAKFSDYDAIFKKRLIAEIIQNDNGVYNASLLVAAARDKARRMVTAELSLPEQAAAAAYLGASGCNVSTSIQNYGTPPSGAK